MRTARESCDVVAEAVTRAHGREHMGKAWLHAHDQIMSRAMPDANVSGAMIERLVAECSSTIEDEGGRQVEAEEPRIHLDPFQAAQRAQCSRIVRDCLRTLKPRHEFVLRSHHAVATRHLDDDDMITGRDGDGWSTAAIGRRIGLTRSMIEVDLGKAMRQLSMIDKIGPAGRSSRRMRAALDQINDVGPEPHDGTNPRNPSSKHAIRRHGPEMVEARLDRLAAHILTRYPELSELSTCVPGDSSSDRLRNMRRRWVNASTLALGRCGLMTEKKPYGGPEMTEIQNGWIERRLDERAIARSMRLFGADPSLEVEIVPAWHASRSRSYQLVARIRGRCSEDYGVMIPSGDPIRPPTAWKPEMDSPTLIDIRESLEKFIRMVQEDEADGW